VRFLSVAAGYAVAFIAARRVFRFSVASPWFACLAMICFLGLAFMVRPVVRIRMPRPLRRIRSAERRFYRALGVSWSGRLIRRTPLRLLNRDVYLKTGPRDLSRLEGELEAAEASHFWAAVLLVPHMAYVAVLEEWSAVWWVSVAQVLVNAYPVMHLRLARGRLERLAARTSA